MPSSRAVVSGEEYTATDINNLRSDVLSGHTHDGTDGTKVPFNNLNVSGSAGSTRPSGGNVSYDEIEAHVAASQGVHGMNASVYAIGSNTADVVCQYGSSTLVLTSGIGIKSITFPIAFSSTPVVFCQLTSDPVWSGGGVHIGDPILATSTTTSGFIAKYPGTDGYTTATFNWIAFGPIT